MFHPCTRSEVLSSITRLLCAPLQARVSSSSDTDCTTRRPAIFSNPRADCLSWSLPLLTLPSRWSLVIWSEAMSKFPSRPVSQGDSCVLGSNKMSYFPFGPLMPPRASARGSLMCRSDRTVGTQTSSLSWRLLVDNRFPLSAVLSGETHWLVLRCPSLFPVPVPPFRSFPNHRRPQVLTAARATAPLSRF